MHAVLNITKMKTCVCVGGGGGGGEGEGGCISKQQNLSRAMRDWDRMHEEEVTLSTMCNTHNEMAAVYRAWAQDHCRTSWHAHKGTPHSPSDVALAEVLRWSDLTDQQLYLATHIHSIIAHHSSIAQHYLVIAKPQFIVAYAIHQHCITSSTHCTTLPMIAQLYVRGRYKL